MANGTLSATLTANGNVVLGSSSSKTLTVNASLASGIPINANATYAFGSATLGLLSIYIGSASSFTTKIVSAATASWTLNLPTGPGVNLQALTTDGSGNTSWQNIYTDPTARQNYGITATVAASALTVNIIGANGSAISATNPVNINFRSATAATGTPTFVQATGALTIVVPSTATLGTVSGVASYIYVWALNNAGTIEMCVTGNLIQDIDEGSVQNTTNIAGGSNLAGTLYSTTGRTGVGVRLLGRILVSEAAAGTWASAPTEIAAGTFLPSSDLMDYYTGYMGIASSWTTGSGTYADGTNTGGNALTKRISSGLIVTAGAGSLAGIVFTPANANAVYKITAITGLLNTSAVGTSNIQMTDGTTVICNPAGFEQQATIPDVIVPITLSGLYAPGVTTACTVKLQLAAPVGAAATMQGLGIGNAIEWEVIQIR